MKQKLFVVAQVVLLALIGNTLIAGAAVNPQRLAPDLKSAKGDQVGTQAGPLTPTGSGFTYQGSLKSGGNPANGQYDFFFTLFDAATGGNQIGSSLAIANQPVTAGLFTVQLDFGAQAFGGDARWLEIAVRQTGGGNYTTLSPRQALTASPYALSLMPGAVISGTVGSSLLTLNNSNSAGDGIDMIVGGSGINMSTTGPFNALYATNSCSCTTIYASNAGTGPGVHGASTNGYGLQGTSSGSLGGFFSSSASNGAEGFSSASGGIGLYGEADTGTGASGVYGSSNTGTGVYAASGGQYGLYAYANGTNGQAVYGQANYGPNAAGVYGTSSSGYGGYFTSSGNNAAGVAGTSTSSDGGVFTSTSGIGVQGTSSNLSGGVFTSSGSVGAMASSSAANSSGLEAWDDNGTGAIGVNGSSNTGTGVSAYSGGQKGLYAYANGTNGYGVYGQANNGSNAAGVYGSSTSGYGGYFTSSSTNGNGVYGQANNGIGAAGVVGTSTSGYGGLFTSTSGIAVNGTSNYFGGFFTSTGNTGAQGNSTATNGRGLLGQANNGANAIGVEGASNNGIGVRADSGGTYGLYATASGTNGYGIFGQANAAGVAGTSSIGYGGIFTSTTGNGIGVLGSSNNGAGAAGVVGTSSSGYGGVFTSTMGNGIGVLGSSNSGTSAVGVYGASQTGYGVYGASNATAPQGTTLAGVFGSINGIGGYGVQGRAYGTDGIGVDGFNPDGTGIGVEGDGGYQGVDGSSSSGAGVSGYSTTGHGIEGITSSGYAGYFYGNVHVTGSCCAAGEQTTQIDDPTDPTNKYLNESVVQSPDMTTVINGNITTGSDGEAAVTLPAWFVAANGDFKYQLTVIGQFAQAIVSSEINNNRFVIKTDKPSVKVSWQVTGVRQDPYAVAHPIQPEQDKPAGQQGKYLYPKELGQPESLGVDYEKSHPQPPVVQPTQQPLPSGH